MSYQLKFYYLCRVCGGIGGTQMHSLKIQYKTLEGHAIGYSLRLVLPVPFLVRAPLGGAQV